MARKNISSVYGRLKRIAAAGAMGQRVTRIGFGYTLAILMIGLAAFSSGNNLLFLLFAAMLATLLVSGFISRLGLANLELDFNLPEHLTARRRIAGRILVRNAKRLLPTFSVHLSGAPGSGFSSILYFPVIPGGAVIDEPVDVFFERRGIYDENSFQFTTRFPFGFTERRATVTTRRDVLVYPSIDPQPGFMELLTSLSGDMEAFRRGRGSDFYRIRPYEAFESSRHVDWKATAHTGDLQVREFAREEEQLLELLLDLRVPDTAAQWFESAIDCCAFLLWRVAERGARIHLRTQNFDRRLPEEGDIYTLLKYLALVRPLPPSAARSHLPHAANDETSFQIAVSATAEGLEEAGWVRARLLAIDAFPPQ